MSDCNDDPFAVFDDSDDNDVDRDEEPSWASQNLLQTINQRMQTTFRETNETATTKTIQNSTASIDSRELSSLLFTSVPCNWKKPLYLGPILLTAEDQFGGGRAYVASRDLGPGTLLLVEEPLLTWPKEQLGKPLDLISVQYILSCRKAQEFLHQFEFLHPTKEATETTTTAFTGSCNSSCSSNNHHHIQVGQMMAAAKEQLESDRIDSLVKLANECHLRNANETLLSSNDIVRLFLALRYNGLESGIYLHGAMLNHACQPNCVKFPPTLYSTNYSEVRTTRHVRAGESLTISYLPRILSHASRRYLLWDQHRFDIGDLTLPATMELVCHNIPMSQPERYKENTISFHVEQATSALEDQYQEVTSHLHDPDIWDQIHALEVTCSELCSQAMFQLKNKEHLLLIPCLRLHLDVCDLVQRGPLTASQRNMLLLRLIESGHALMSLQSQFYGDHHFELAKTYLDMSQAMEELLSKGHKLLLERNLPTLSTFADCSKLEYRCKREHERIKALYPHDAEDFIGTNHADCQQS